jgi:hypothetical protein
LASGHSSFETAKQRYLALSREIHLVSRREQQALASITLAVVAMILMAAFVIFLAADKLGDVDILISVCFGIYLLLSAFLWWFNTMKQCVWITKALGQVLLTMKRNRVIAPDGPDWCPANEFSEFMSFAQERYLTHSPGLTMFGKTIDYQTVLRGLWYMLYVTVILIGRTLLAALDN